MHFHYSIMKTHSMLIRRISYRAQNELGLSSGQPKVLDCLLDYEGSDQKTIASVCEIEQATLGSILTRMEDKGLIKRVKQAGNRRSLFVYFTDYGREVAEKMRVIFEQEDKKATEALSAEECEYLNKILEKICRKMVFDSEGKHKNEE